MVEYKNGWAPETVKELEMKVARDGISFWTEAYGKLLDKYEPLMETFQNLQAEFRVMESSQMKELFEIERLKRALAESMKIREEVVRELEVPWRYFDNLHCSTSEEKEDMNKIVKSISQARGKLLR